MPKLWRRAGSVTIGDRKLVRKFADLDFAFDVEKSLEREPNTAEIQIFNLAESTRQEIEQTEDQRVQLQAGYDQPGGLRIIFDGDLRKAHTTKPDATFITTIEAADGERAYRTARINQSFGAQTTLASVIESAGEALGVGVGNLPDLARQAGFEGLGNIFSEGTVVSGPAREELSGLVDSAGLEWSIQDGNLQLLPRNGALAGTAILLTPQTGLVGSPAVDSEGVLTAKMLLAPDVFPGRLVQVESRFVRGLYRVTAAKYTGETTVGANEWFIDLEGQPVGE